jgi:glucokinase
MEIKRDDTALPSVVADIGATNIRFARLSPRGALGPVAKFSIAEFPDLTAALDRFLNLDGGPRPVRLGLAVAGPVFGDEVKLTNAQWQFSIRQLKKQMNLQQLAVANDLEALARVLPYLGSEDAVPIGTEVGKRSTKAPLAVLCPGTGMGIAGLKPTDRGWQPIASEGGHTSLSPLTDRELGVWQVLRARYGRVSVERVLSGPGIVELHGALASLEGQVPETERPEEVVRLALNGESPLAIETIEIFCAWLGDVAGDVALMYLAHGGVYLAGDILLSILEILKRSLFRDRFENKGRVTAVVAQIPTFLITNKSPVLLGCTRLLRSLRHRGETNLPAATLPA